MDNEKSSIMVTNLEQLTIFVFEELYKNLWKHWI